MLELESRRYAQLREYMAQTRRLRHDFRQHLHVIAGLTESGKMEELRAYLKEYESEFVDAHATFCAMVRWTQLQATTQRRRRRRTSHLPGS